MKKRILIVLLILLVVLNNSCGMIQITQTQETTTSSGEIKNSEFRDSPKTYSYGTFSEYEEGIATLELSDDFIHYDRLEELGEFEYFYFINGMIDGTPVNNFDMYSYDLSAGSQRICLEVYHNLDYFRDEFKEFWEDENLPEPTEDMRTISETGGGVYRLNDEIIYEYSRDGFLWVVSWISNGVAFYLCDGLSQFPNDDSLVSRLLNKSTALEAKAEFEAMVFGNE